ncbi:MAG: T9SS type A sorting domain-containing protein, partial [Candidatus Margulisbacteria bacterium]|nr:T9SS type A sorting domain-containing protein [Candidatus Margulisiibacteriota bacterium]
STTAITWSASDAGSGIADHSIALYYTTGEGDVLITDNLSNSGSYDWAIPAIDSKQVKIKAVAQDNVGESNEDLSDSVFEIDSTPPDPPTIDPVKSPTVLLSQGISGTKTFDAAIILINGHSENVNYPSLTAWSASVSLFKGINTLEVVAYDTAGNSSEAAEATIEVKDLNFTATDEEISVTVPAGAPSEEVEYMDFARVALPGVNPAGSLALEQAIQITSNVNSFSSPIEITFPIPPGASHPRSFIWDPAGNKWTVLPLKSSTASSITFGSDQLGVFAVFEVIDFNGPTVDNVKIGGRNVSSGDSIISKPSLTLDISDNYAVDASQMFISVDGAAPKSLSGSKASQTSASISYTFSDSDKLSLGDHTFKITAADEVGNTSIWETTLYVVGDSISGLLIYPNPYTLGNANCIKIDGLTEDVHVRIYDIAGDLVWSGQNMPGSASLTWDANNSSGNQVAPGIYFYVAVTDSGGKQSGKIAIIR